MSTTPITPISIHSRTFPSMAVSSTKGVVWPASWSTFIAASPSSEGIVEIADDHIRPVRHSSIHQFAASGHDADELEIFFEKLADSGTNRSLSSANNTRSLPISSSPNITASPGQRAMSLRWSNEGGSGQSDHSSRRFSGERMRTMPRLLLMTPSRSHCLSRRLTVKWLTSASEASCSFLMRMSMLEGEGVPNSYAEIRQCARQALLSGARHEFLSRSANSAT